MIFCVCKTAHCGFSTGRVNDGLGQPSKQLAANESVGTAGDPALLKGTHEVVDREVQFALENHIPVLPLLQRAAQAGILAATDQLVYMFASGKGVQQNLHMASHWQNLLVEQCRAAWSILGVILLIYIYYFSKVCLLSADKIRNNRCAYAG